MAKFSKLYFKIQPQINKMKKLTISTSCALLFVLTFSQEIFAQPSSKNLYTYPFGVQAYTFRNHFPKDVSGTLDKIQKMGITEIETSGAKGVTDDSPARTTARFFSRKIFVMRAFLLPTPSLVSRLGMTGILIAATVQNRKCLQ